jgi:hypothetical protein
VVEGEWGRRKPGRTGLIFLHQGAGRIGRVVGGGGAARNAFSWECKKINMSRAARRQLSHPDSVALRLFRWHSRTPVGQVHDCSLANRYMHNTATRILRYLRHCRAPVAVFPSIINASSRRILIAHQSSIRICSRLPPQAVKNKHVVFLSLCRESHLPCLYLSTSIARARSRHCTLVLTSSTHEHVLLS